MLYAHLVCDLRSASVLFSHYVIHWYLADIKIMKTKDVHQVLVCHRSYINVFFSTVEASPTLFAVLSATLSIVSTVL